MDFYEDGWDVEEQWPEQPVEALHTEEQDSEDYAENYEFNYGEDEDVHDWPGPSIYRPVNGILSLLPRSL